MRKLKSMLFLMLFPIFLMSGFVWATSDTANKQETTGQYMSDTSITTKVKSDFLLDKDIKSLSISVATDKGIVTLSGNVENEIQKQKAVSIARHVTGVKSVKDELIIKAK